MENYDNFMDFLLNATLIVGAICGFVLIVASYFTWGNNREIKKINSATKKRHPNPNGLHVYNDKIRTLERRIEFKLERKDGTITNEIHALYSEMTKKLSLGKLFTMIELILRLLLKIQNLSKP